MFDPALSAAIWPVWMDGSFAVATAGPPVIAVDTVYLPMRSLRNTHPAQQFCEARVAADCVPHRLVFKKASDRSRC
jgi:hypothetical protein